ncbi:MAG: hypothetical protein K2W96_00875 [Gemmataceae bacterium]|nr:hypothetical protein [Gemmataceae bacterium]
MCRIMLLALLVLLVAWPTDPFAAPLPVRLAGGELIEANDLRLEIRSSLSSDNVDRDDLVNNRLLVRLSLVNLSKNIRQVDQLKCHGNRIDRCWGLTYFAWFPDGNALEITPRIEDGTIPRKAGKPQPLLLPGEGYSTGEHNAGRGLLFKHAYDQFKKHKGKFCLTAVVAELGVQSNTIPYNGCPMPPEKYVPWKLSKNTAERVRARKIEQEEREEDARRLDLELPPIRPRPQEPPPPPFDPKRDLIPLRRGVVED